MVVVGLSLLGAAFDVLPETNEFLEIDFPGDWVYSGWKFYREGFLIADGAEIACHGVGFAYLGYFGFASGLV